MTVRRALSAGDPSLPLSDIRSGSQVLAQTIAPRRFLVLLLGSFAGLAVVVAGVGIHGVMAYVVGPRTREIGVRPALGARPAQVLRQVLRDGLAVVGVGMAAGVLAALALSRLIRGFLFDVSPTDPATYAGVLLALVAVAGAACYVPARRAARIDPMVALRYE
jgi:ABC-type antimicrobial peptide transport system permease subunit